MGYQNMETMSFSSVFKLSRLMFMLALCATMQEGCVGLGAWTLGSRTESSETPHIYRMRGAVDVRGESREGDIKTGAEVRTSWGEPDQVLVRDDGKEEWTYKTKGWRWNGVVLYAVVVPLPIMIPWGTQYVSVLVNNGQIESATRGDWDFQAGAYCGFFSGWGCGAGSFEQERRSEARRESLNHGS
jgi:hypothetical protein